MEKKKILLIGTGGTIASELGENGLKPELTSEQLLRYIPDIDRICRVECEQLFSLDSTNIQPKHWVRIVGTIQRRYREFDGFVIAHGTDTMAYTAAGLSYLIQGSPKPIILTGSQKPICFETTDSKQNLRDAFTVAASDMAGVALMKLVPGADCGIAAYLLKRHDALIIESFGVGGLPTYRAGDYYDVVKAGLDAGKTVVMTTQVENEGSDLAVYHVGSGIKRNLPILEAYDMTTEAVTAKLMWILGQTTDPKWVEELFYTPVACDILAGES